MKHIIRCYLRLSDNARAREALRSCLPDCLKDHTFVNEAFHYFYSFLDAFLILGCYSQRRPINQKMAIAIIAQSRNAGYRKC